MGRNDQLPGLADAPTKIAETENRDDIQRLKRVVQHEKRKRGVLSVEGHPKEVGERHHVQLALTEHQERVRFYTTLPVADNWDDLITVPEDILMREELSKRRARIEPLEDLREARL